MSIDVLSKVLKLKPIGFDARMRETLKSVVLEIVPADGNSNKLVPVLPAAIKEFLFCGEIDGLPQPTAEVRELKRECDLVDFNIDALQTFVREGRMAAKLGNTLADTYAEQREQIDARLTVLMAHILALVTDVDAAARGPKGRTTGRAFAQSALAVPPEIPTHVREASRSRQSMPKVEVLTKPVAATGRTLQGMRPVLVALPLEAPAPAGPRVSVPNPSGRTTTRLRAVTVPAAPITAAK